MRPICTWAYVIPVVLAVVVGPRVAGATIYQCGDRDGATVFTDSPAQLKNCVTLGSPGPQSPISPPPPPVLPVPFSDGLPPGPGGQSVFTDKPPNYSSGPPMSPSDATPAADRDIGPASPQEPMTAAAPGGESQRCASPINPFNPLMAVPCPPSGVNGQPTSEPDGASPAMPPTEPMPRPIEQ